MLRVKLTNHGRAAARAGLSRQPGGKPKNVLPARTWEVLGFLWAAGQRGEPLKWGFSRTIEYSLFQRHDPPLAESVPGGYALTDRGRQFYREAYPVHAAAHPDVRVPHPDGAAADPWPARADQVLLAHRARYHAPPAQTGVHAIDDHARKLHAAAAGTPVKGAAQHRSGGTRRGTRPSRRHPARSW